MNVSFRLGNKKRSGEGGLARADLRLVLLMFAIATAAGLFYAYTAVHGLNLSFQASEALKEQRQLREVARRLTVELNHLRAPQRLEREGARLGLAPPKPNQIRSLP